MTSSAPTTSSPTPRVGSPPARIIVGVHTTTVRFADDTWHDAERAAAAAGIPVAQFIREATIARLAVGLRDVGVVDLGERVQLLEAQVGQLRRIVAGRR